MPTQTKRDKIWGTTLQLVADREQFDIADVLTESDLDWSTKRTARDVLSSMAAQGWIQKGTCEETGRRLYSRGDRLAQFEAVHGDQA